MVSNLYSCSFLMSSSMKTIMSTNLCIVTLCGKFRRWTWANLDFNRCHDDRILMGTFEWLRGEIFLAVEIHKKNYNFNAPTREARWSSPPPAWPGCLHCRNLFEFSTTQWRLWRGVDTERRERFHTSIQKWIYFEVEEERKNVDLKIDLLHVNNSSERETITSNCCCGGIFHSLLVTPNRWLIADGREMCDCEKAHTDGHQYLKATETLQSLCENVRKTL